ncbi:MAG: ABC transporter permease, partial [Deltaproteobacteria bacterium]|nr:ABC transporter permease [Deltaproteobacteria bacterium]
VDESTRVGYVDQVGNFNGYLDQGIIQLYPYQSEDSANAALVEGEIDEFFLIPSDFSSMVSIERYTMAREFETPMAKRYAISSFLISNMLKDEVPPGIIETVLTPLDMSVTRLDEDGSVADSQSNIGNIIIPGIYAFLLSMALMFGNNSLISGLGEEKESRLIEVLTSSVSVSQMLIGKVLALGAAGLLQVLLWLVSAPLILDLASSTFGGLLANIQIPPNFIVFGVVYFVLGYLLFAVLAVMIGGIVSTAADGHNLSMFYIMAGYIPLWTFGAFISFPEHPIWVVLSIFPITAPTQTMLRLGVSDIPTWQLGASLGVMILSIAIGQFLSVKIFRTFMLMYGKRPRAREIFQALKSA